MNKENSKNTILKGMPEKWDVKTLGEIAKITSGGTPNRKNSEYWNGSIPWITTSLIDFNVISHADEYISEEGLKNSSAKIFPKETLLIALYGQGITRGKVAKLNMPAATNQACAAIIPTNPNINIDFLFQYLIFNYSNLRNLSNGGSQENLSGEILKEFSLKIPPIFEQTQISKISSTWDKAIEKQQQIINSLRVRHRALMQQLISGKKSLTGTYDVWKTVHLSDVLERITNGLVYDPESRQGLPVTRIETISSGKVNLDKVGFAEAEQNHEEYRVKYGDILYSHINSLPHIGKVAMFLEEKPLYHGMNLVLMRVKLSVNRDFIYFWLCSEMARKQARNLAKPAVNQASISISELKKMELKLPSINEQVAIANILSSSAAEVELNQRRLAALQQQKKGLMQLLLTGKVRVKVPS